MIRNIRRTLVLAALTISGLAAMTPKASADQQIVPFTGTVNSICTFSNINPGALGADLASNTLDSAITTSPATTAPGSSGSITVACNTVSGSSYKIFSTVNTTAFPGAPIPTSVTVTASSTPGTSSAFGTTGTTTGNTVNITTTNAIPITVNLAATYPSTLVTGTYSFDVIMEALP